MNQIALSYNQTNQVAKPRKHGAPAHWTPARLAQAKIIILVTRYVISLINILFAANLAAMQHIASFKTEDYANKLFPLHNSKVAAVYSFDDEVAIYDTKTQTACKPLKYHDFVYSLCALSNEQVAAGLDKNILLWDPETGDITHTLEGHTSRVNLLAAMARSAQFPEGQLISASFDDTIKLWDLKDGGCHKTFKSEHLYHIQAFATLFLNRLASGSSDSIRVRDLHSGQILHKISRLSWLDPKIYLTRLSHNLLAASSLKNIKIFEVSSGNEITNIDTNGQICGLVTLPNGDLACGLEDGKVLICNPETHEIQTIQGNNQTIKDLQVLETGSLVSIDNNGNLDLFDRVCLET